MGANTLLQRLKRVPGLRLCCDLLRGPDRRAIALLRLRNPRGLFQPYANTKMMRRPRLFEQARALVGDSPQTRVLSFGCSKGDEVVSLRHYFPQSRITGIDINPRAIALCRARTDIDDRMEFHQGSSVTPQMGPFDAIFAFSVFRHGDLMTTPPRCDHLITFQEFDRITKELAATLRPGGLFLIAHANFRFTDTQVGRDFEIILERVTASENPIYGPDNRLLADAADLRAIYRKKQISA